jgi:hypothetical protein
MDKSIEITTYKAIVRVKPLDNISLMFTIKKAYYYVAYLVYNCNKLINW